MDAARIQARAVIKVAAISLAVIAAVFLTLALLPAVDRLENLRIRGHQILPRWLAILVVYLAALAFFVFLVLQVVPPIVRELEELGSKAPGYVADFREWANQNPQFQ